MAGLFAFEFVVVVLGVLTAQAVADWSNDRAARAEMRASRERADSEIAFMSAVATAYARTIPCIEQRMTTLMRASSAGSDVEASLLVRPIVWSFPFTELTVDTLLTMRAASGSDTSEHYRQAAFYAARGNRLVDDLADDWEALSIISPESGVVGPGDRQQARILASRARSTLRSLSQISRNIRFRAEKIGVAPRLGPGQRLPRSCAEMWQWGSVLYDPPDGEAGRDRASPPA
ncbi:hypothetical protein [Sphingomonas mesophila]|uniref:hypothetical protein n=1 Tax=Sphingomonas mesophila TaxID=2303576 RepID=UPI0013C2D190|nr:hypothetical protein [Sphingomonas mesophila]